MAGAVDAMWVRVVTLLIVAAALLLGLYLHRWNESHPSSDDASLDAEVVHMAAQVGGRIIDLAVKENARVKQGDLLFRLDPAPLQLAVNQAQAELELALAALETTQRQIVSEKLNAKIAAEEQQKARTHLELAERTTTRLRPLSEKAYVPAQTFDQAQSAQREAATALQQAEQQKAAAEHLIGKDAGALATVRARQAALAIARHALGDTEVRAPHAGRVVGLNVATGETVAPGQALFTLIVTDEWLAVANFRESELPNIHEGDCATVFSMIDRRHAIRGEVESSGWGVMDADRVNLPKSLPYVQKSLNWVRVAQRFPVRVRLADPPEPLMRLGASAVVEIRHGAACGH